MLNYQRVDCIVQLEKNTILLWLDHPMCLYFAHPWKCFTALCGGKLGGTSKAKWGDVGYSWVFGIRIIWWTGILAQGVINMGQFVEFIDEKEWIRGQGHVVVNPGNPWWNHHSFHSPTGSDSCARSSCPAHPRVQRRRKPEGNSCWNFLWEFHEHSPIFSLLFQGDPDR